MPNTQEIANIKVVCGKRVRALRKASGATQQSVADHCGIYRTYLSRIESGVANPSLEVLADLAACFGVAVGSLLTENPGAEALTALYAGSIFPETAPHPASFADS